MEYLAFFLNFTTNGLIAFTLMTMVINCYRKNPYLFKKENAPEWIYLLSDKLVPIVEKLELNDYRSNIRKKLATLGKLSNDKNGSYFISFQLSLFILTTSTTFMMLYFFTSKAVIFALIFGLLAYFLPFIKITEQASLITKACDHQLPFFIDFLSLTMGAGLDFNNALESVIHSSRETPLTKEFKQVMRDMRLGTSRKDALLKMDGRMNVPTLRLFIHTLVQGIEMGTDMLKTLANLSQIFQTKKFQKAEEDAGKISVQMMIPMMVFVMPAVMIILLGPLVLQYSANM